MLVHSSTMKSREKETASWCILLQRMVYILLQLVVYTSATHGVYFCNSWYHPHHHHHLSLNHEGRWGTTDDFATSFLHLSPFSTALCDLVNSRPVHSRCCLPNSSFVSLVFFPLPLCRARWFWPDLMNGRHDRTTAVCISL